MWVRLVVLCGMASSLSACGSSLPACRPSFVRAEDGHCYPPPPDPDPPTFSEAFESLPPCAAQKSGIEIDLPGGCIEGGCAQSDYASFESALGLDVDCGANDFGEWDCLWPQGIAALFPPAETDSGGPSDSSITAYVRARNTYEGASADGLGIGVSLRCFTEALGNPDNVLLVLSVNALVPQQLEWDLLGIEIEDEEREVDLLAFPDGLVDEITLFGP